MKARIGVPRQAVEGKGMHADVAASVLKAMDQLRQAGHTVEVYDFPLLDYLLPCYYILTTAEASSNLSRYDGVKYGYRDMEAQSLDEMYKNTRSKGFGAEVKRRIFLGTFVLSASYYDAYFTKAQRVRRLIKEENERLLSRFDLLLMPTTPSPAYKIGEKTQDPLEMYLGDIFTVQANVTGQPGLSVPAGTTAAGLPIGLQLMGRHFEEDLLLKGGRELENALH
jgi:aspartyl-tRNA(Asn)/glutamyl-tRNA(Gln) amidotransferase subunit A